MVTNELKEYIQKRDVEKVRKELLAILNTNPDMGDGQFEENLNYAIRILGENAIYTPYSGVFEMKNSKEEWTTSYVAKIYLPIVKKLHNGTYRSRPSKRRGSCQRKTRRAISGGSV